MDKNRLINTKIWDDTYIASLKKEGKLLFLYYLTNALTNIAGIYQIGDRKVLFDTGLTPEELEEVKLKFEQDGKIYFKGDWVAMTNFIKHQKKNPKVCKGILAILKQCPQDLVDRLCIDYDSLSIGYQSLSHSNSNSNLNSNSNSNSKYIYNTNTNTSNNNISAGKKLEEAKASTHKEEKKEEKDKKEKKEVKKFIPPTLNEIKAYCIERKNTVNPKKFFDFFTEGNWVDAKGNKVRNWKQKIITWEGNYSNSSNTSNISKPANVLKTAHSSKLVEEMQKRAEDNR